MHFMLSRVRVWVCACVKVRDRNRHKSWCSKGLREGKGERHDLDTIVYAEWENIQGPPIGGTINSRHFFLCSQSEGIPGRWKYFSQLNMEKRLQNASSFSKVICALVICPSFFPSPLSLCVSISISPLKSLNKASKSWSD